jgi:hypothetical protein
VAEIGGPDRPAPEAAQWKHRLWQADWAWRRIVPVIAVAMAAFAVISNGHKVDKAEFKATRAQQGIAAQITGRRVAIRVLCGFANGVANAGRNVIASGDVGPPTFKRNLQRLGLPPDKVRRAAAQQSAKNYVESLTNSVVQQSGASGKNLVRKDGTLDCAVLQQKSRATVTDGQNG